MKKFFSSLICYQTRLRKGYGWQSTGKLNIPCHICSYSKMNAIERSHWRYAVLQHGLWIAQTDLDIQGSHAHHARTRSSCAWTTNGEVHGDIITHNNVKICLHKWILIAVAIEAAILEDSMTSRENALQWQLTTGRWEYANSNTFYKQVHYLAQMNMWRQTV